MRVVGLWIALALVSFSVGQETKVELTNGGFERLGANQFPVDWVWFATEPHNAVVRITTDAAEGRLALYMEARTTTTVGLNRTYRTGKPGEVVPDLGALLPVKKGALIFRYKVLKATTDNIRVYAIPMRADNIEGGASRVTYIIPPQFAGDNKWHTGILAFDFSDKPEVRSVQVGLRINEGGQPAPAAVVFDDIRFVDRAGWHLRLDRIRFEEGAKPGEEGYFVLHLENTGDAPAPINATLLVPTKFESELVNPPKQIMPKEIATLRWWVKGVRRIGTKFAARWEASPQTEETVSHTCYARLRLRSFNFANAVLFANFPAQLRLVLGNEGDAVIEGLEATLSLKGLTLVQGPAKTKLPNLLPGLTTIAWTVQSRSPALVNASLQLQVGRTPFNTNATAVVSRPINERDKGTLIVATPTVRLLFPSNPFGYGVFAVEVRNGKGWRRMALSPELLRVAYLDERGQTVSRFVFAPKPEKLPNGGLAFPVRWQDVLDGAVWQGEVRLEPDGNAVKVSWHLQVNRVKQLLGVHGPILFVGDQTFGTRKTMALLPGIYWLTQEETVDDARYSDPPHHLHIVPHPYKLTQPMMVIAHEGAFVGLLWDALQRWTSDDGLGAETGLCPQPIFLVPNILEHRDNHLLALMVPNVPKWVSENTVWAKTPLRWGRGRGTEDEGLRLTAWIIGGTGGILDAYDEYFAKFSLPPVPERPYPDEETFRRSKLGARSPRYGRLLANLQTLEHNTLEDARTQRADGSWGFVLDQGWTLEMLRKFAPHRPLSDYGQDGDTTVGTCTFLLRRAIALLRYARIFGSAKAAELGINAIRFIDKTFVRPEGAQTWEVPLHCPDVLAAANAIHAYLEAWHITGDDYWLRRASYWAKTGLPFIYLWNPPDRPTMMRYASIPVFGTSFFSAAPWFGTPVQWNGLDYAYALLKLARALEQWQTQKATKVDRWLEPSFWRQIAEGITVCGIQHQASVNHPEGNYPDSVALTYRYGPTDPGVIGPHGIVRNLWLLQDPNDDDWGYETVTVRTGAQTPPFRITSEAVVKQAEWQEATNTLVFVLRAPQGVERTLTAVASITKPTAVSVQGGQLAWQRYDARRYLWIGAIQHEGATAIVQIVGGQPILYAGLGVVWEVPVWEFATEDDPEDWVPAHDLAPFEVRDGILRTRSTGSDPYMHSPPVRLDATKFHTLRIRLRLQFPQGAEPVGQLFWTREDDQKWSESKSIRCPLPTDGQWHEISVNLTASPEWRGIITQLRFDPGSGTGILVEIDSLRCE